MKFTSALVIAALLGASTVVEQSQAIKLTDPDDLIKSLAEDMQKETESSQEGAAEAAPEEKPAPKPEKKAEPKKNAKKTEKKESKAASKKKDDKKSKKEEKKKPVEKKKEEQDDIPMDAAAIKAYSSVIADAAMDSEPSVPVQYHEVITDDDNRKSKAEPLSIDPMGSMIQNELSDIKDASIKAAQEKDMWTKSVSTKCAWVDLTL